MAKFYVLNETGHTTLEATKEEFDRLIKEGYEARTKGGEAVKDFESIPDTVEELIFGQPFVFGMKSRRGN